MPSFTSSSKCLVAIFVATALLISATFLGLSEWLIASLIVKEEAFNQSVELYHRVRTSGAANAVFGDSTTARGIIIDRPDFVNLSAGGEGLGLTRAKVLNFFVDRPAGLVVLPAGANTLSRSVPAPDARTDMYGVKVGLVPYVSLRHHQAFLLAYWRVYLVNGGFKSTIQFLPYGGQVATGYDRTPVYGNLPAAQRVALSRSHVLEELPAFAAGRNPTFVIYDDLLADLLGKGARVCLIGMPRSPEYRALARAYRYFDEEVPRLWGDYAGSFGSQVRYVNAYAWTDDLDLYYDPTHLNETGGRMFAPWLLDRCFGAAR